MANKCINKVILLGNLGHDPEIRHTSSGLAVTTISIATTESRRDKQTNEWHERVEWHRVVFFGRTAEVCQQYTRKGTKIFVEGSIQTKKWTDKEGLERSTVEIIGNELVLLDRKGDIPIEHNLPGNIPEYTRENQPDFSEAPAPVQKYEPMGARAGDDDDIPF